MHIPDGVLPAWIIIAGWIATASILAFCIRSISPEDVKRKLPLIGIVSALMIVGMTLEIVPIAYHINLSIIAGILLGPALAFISVFMVDLLISMFGHGGVTVVGLNTLVIGAEAVLGYYLFLIFSGAMKNRSVGWSSALATVLSLLLSTFVMLGIVYVSHANPGVAIGFGHGHQGIDFPRFVKTVLILAPLGWALEAAVTGLVITYLYRVRPDLILSGRSS